MTHTNIPPSVFSKNLRRYRIYDVTVNEKSANEIHPKNMARQSSTEARVNGERYDHTATLPIVHSSAVSKAKTIPHNKQCKRPGCEKLVLNEEHDQTAALSHRYS
jgi:hypothetical protein